MEPKYGICVANTIFCKLGTLVAFFSKHVFILGRSEKLSNVDYDENCFQIMTEHVWDCVKTLKNPHDRIEKVKFLASLKVKDFVHVVAAERSINGQIVEQNGFSCWVLDLVI